MNLPLHYGLAGALEAGLIALLLGFVAYLGWRWLARRTGLTTAHALAWSCVLAIAIGAGIDAWNMFYLGIARLESPLYARLALQKIHDAESLGARVLCEVSGAVAGVVLSWWLFSSGSRHGEAEEVRTGGENPR